jgi:hypothetical protein
MIAIKELMMSKIQLTEWQNAAFSVTQAGVAANFVKVRNSYKLSQDYKRRPSQLKRRPRLKAKRSSREVDQGRRPEKTLPPHCRDPKKRIHRLFAHRLLLAIVISVVFFFTHILNIFLLSGLFFRITTFCYTQVNQYFLSGSGIILTIIYINTQVLPYLSTEICHYCMNTKIETCYLTWYVLGAPP